MRGLCFALAALGSVGAHAQVLESSAHWSEGVGANGHFYMLYSVQGGVGWADANALADSLSGHLASVASGEENEFIYGALGIGANNKVWHVDSYGSHIGPWLGGFQPDGSPEPGGGWAWVTGEPWVFARWAPGEPNNLGGLEGRVHFFGNPSRTSQWNDITNSVLIEGFVVEFDAPPCNAADLAGPFGILDLSDVTLFVGAFVALQPEGDLNNDGLHDLRDVVSFVDAFLAGCP
jgi:hypothetical protein